MEMAVPAAHAVAAETTGPVVTASDITRRYGEGETAVDALAASRSRSNAAI